jgi:hypothetical protein
MTSRHLLLISSVALLGLAACGERDKAAPTEAVAVSETVAEPAGSEAPAAAEAASDAAAAVPAPASAAVEPADLDPEDIAATGDTRRRPTETPPPIAPEQPPQ